MMELKNTEWEIELTVQAGTPEPHWDDRLLQSAAGNPEPGLLDGLRLWKTCCDVDNLRVKLTGGDNEFSYRFILTDTRVWKSVVVIGTGATDTTMSFDVPDQWTGAELIHMRTQVLTQIIALSLAYKIQLLKVQWL